jgi:Ni,Fe-hydrogenase III small subunit/formate hydrogenlyase subunit 6/NADH:ubiquinone oxidoreductase subunit I
MYNIIKKYIQHGIVTVEYPKKPVNTDFITGRPVVDAQKCTGCSECSKRCPASAIIMDEVPAFNIDECIFCSNCADACPAGAIEMNHAFELAERERMKLRASPLTIGERDLPSADYELIGKRLKENIGRYFGRSLQIREVDAGSCNGCDNEINALNSPYNDLERFGIHFVASPRHADMLLVTGPATRNMELALVKTYNAVPDPKLVVAVGACACSGGIFRDSYSTKNGIDRIVPVDVYIPGCPPRPQAIIYGILISIVRTGNL